MTKPPSAPLRLQSAPPFTGSLDARVPAENVVLCHYMRETGRWIAASQSSDGRVFIGNGATEALARRSAGLRTLQHLKARADGEDTELTQDEIEKARQELIAQLAEVRQSIAGYNGPFPLDSPREVLLLQVDAAQQAVVRSPEREALFRWVVPVLIFLAAAFGEGVIGAYAEKAVDTVNRLLAN